MPKKKKRRRGLWIVFVILLAMGVGGYFLVESQKSYGTIAYQSVDAVLDNPYIGQALYATSQEDIQQPFQLVFAILTWAEFEPEAGVYDFDSFEKKNQLQRWREEGKHLILRFVMDYPSTPDHRDIPQWLYEATGQDGVAYSGGYSPNYNNAALIDAHAKAIAALGARYDGDPFVAAVQLGSLGLWGEWHVSGVIGAQMPETAVRDQYVKHYLATFKQTPLMMRRPFTIAAKNGMGLFNDMAGDMGATSTWLTWIEEGGVYDQTGETDAMAPMPNAWQHAPIGGEISSALDRLNLLDGALAATLKQFDAMHISWIGPSNFLSTELSDVEQEGLDTLLNHMGYRFHVASMTVKNSWFRNLHFSIEWENHGNAPFYYEWKPMLMIVAEDDERSYYELKGKLADVLPGSRVTMTASISRKALKPGVNTVYVGIAPKYATHEAGIALATDVPNSQHWYMLGQLRPGA